MKKLVIETEKLKENISALKAMTSSKIIAVLKGNAYGLDILKMAEIMLENGIDFFAVSEIEEALSLRKGGFTNPVLLLSSTSDTGEISLLIENDIILTAGSFSSLAAIDAHAASSGITAEVHLKMDTGFGRYGFLLSEMDKLVSALAGSNNIHVGGTYTHLSSAFAKKPKITFRQYDKFKKSIEILKNNNINPGILHITNSSAFLLYKELHLDAVRVGSAFLGRIPVVNLWGLKKIGYLESAISEIKTLPAKHPVGYANTYSTKTDTRVGIVPVGYMDGFGVEKSRDTFRFMDVARYVYHDLKSLRRSLYVKVNGKDAPIVGRVNMYNIIIDLKNIDAKIGDEVILNINPLFVNPSIKREYI